MSNRIVVIGEAEMDAAVACELIDQSLLRCPELHWVTDDSDLDTHREYVGFESTQQFVRWDWFDTINTKDYRFRSRGRFSGNWPTSDIALRVKRAIFHFMDTGEFVVIVKDTDGNVDRLTELREVFDSIANWPAVLGVQHTKVECWLLAGFNPQNDADEERSRTIRLGEWPGIGFDPCSRSHELTATGPPTRDHPRNAKRVLKFLIGENWRVALHGLHRDNHPTLDARGKQNGLADFLSDIRSRLIRLVFGI